MQLLRENGALFSLLREQGYTLSGAGDAALYGLPSAVGAVDMEAETVSGESIADLLIKRTPLYIFHSSDYPKDAKEILMSIDYMKDPNNHTRTNRFTLCHLNIPHQPFIFDKNGNLNRVVSINWEDQNYYRNQYIFASTIEAIIQCQSNNSRPQFSDKECITVYLWGISQRRFEQTTIYQYTKNHLLDWFPRLPQLSDVF